MTPDEAFAASAGTGDCWLGTAPEGQVLIRAIYAQERSVVAEILDVAEPGWTWTRATFARPLQVEDLTRAARDPRALLAQISEKAGVHYLRTELGLKVSAICGVRPEASETIGVPLSTLSAMESWSPTYSVKQGARGVGLLCGFDIEIRLTEAGRRVRQGYPGQAFAGTLELAMAGGANLFFPSGQRDAADWSITLGQEAAAFRSDATALRWTVRWREGARLECRIWVKTPRISSEPEPLVEATCTAWVLPDVPPGLDPVLPDSPFEEGVGWTAPGEAGGCVMESEHDLLEERRLKAILKSGGLTGDDEARAESCSLAHEVLRSRHDLADLRSKNALLRGEVDRLTFDELEPSHGILRALDGRRAVGSHPLALQVQQALEELRCERDEAEVALDVLKRRMTPDGATGSPHEPAGQEEAAREPGAGWSEEVPEDAGPYWRWVEACECHRVWLTRDAITFADGSVTNAVSLKPTLWHPWQAEPPAPPTPPETAPGPGAWTDRPLTHGPHWMVSRRTGRVLVDVQIRADHAPYDRITRGPLNDTDARWWAFPTAPKDSKESKP